MASVRLLLAFCLFSLLCVAIQGETDGYAGAQVLKVFTDSNGKVDNLVKDEGLDVWSKTKKNIDVLVPATKISSFTENLRAQKISFKTMISDVQEAIKNENPARKKGSRAGAKYRMNWQQYQTLDVIYEFLDALARHYPKFVSVGIIGYTTEKRPIKFIKIWSGQPNAKAVFVDGGIHAREWVSQASMTYIIRELVENRNKLPKELLGLDFYVVPVLNPDGYVYTHTTNRMWRKNRSMETRCAGVDLNRNFADHFGGKGTSGNPCDETYRGKAGASEPETRALQNYLSKIRNLKGYLTFHSYSQLIMTPFGYDYNSFSDNHAQLQKVGEEAARAIQRAGGPAYDVGNIAHIIYPAAGGSIDWVKTNLRVPFTYAVELRDTGRYGFLLPAKFIKPTAIDAWETVKVVAAAASKA